MADRKLIASAVADSRLGCFDEIISNQFDNIDLSPMMIYLIDCVDKSALPWLAKQFDVDGFKGFDQCATVADQRELLKNAIQLHRNIGTIWGINKACSIIGFVPKSIKENIPIVPGGPNVWCAFSVELTPADLGKISKNSLTMLKSFIGYYKNARSILVEVYFGIEVSDDTLQISDTLTLSGGDYNDDWSDDFLNS
jgi:P2-related tail formation protein